MGDYKIVTYKEEKKGLKKRVKQMFFWEILQGMSLTFKYMLSKPITMRYPEHKWVAPDRFRGQVALVRDEKKMDQDLCVGCCLCIRVCPSGALDIITSMGKDGNKVIDEYVYDMSRCIYCGMCVEICPVDALISTGNYELAEDDMESLMMNKEALLKSGHRWCELKKIMAKKGIKSQSVIRVKPAKWTLERANVREEDLEVTPDIPNIYPKKPM